MNQPIYDTIGENYNANRRADPRILQKLITLLALPKGALIADIGAGTGNYANALGDAGYSVIAIEPSKVMRKQALPHPNVIWREGTAEVISIEDNGADGIIAVLCLHHFQSLEKAVKEFHRICPAGPLVILTYDPRRGRDFWFNSYFPGIYQREHQYFPPLNEVAELLAGESWRAEINDFPLPHDLKDRNMHAGWNRPEYYFDEQARNNTSGFARANKKEVVIGLAKLKKDSESGDWDAQYGHLRHQQSLNTGFAFIKLSTK